MRYQLRYIRMPLAGLHRLYPILHDNAKPRVACCELWAMWDLREHPVGVHGMYIENADQALCVRIVERAIGAVGSALPSHGRGRGFESRIAH